MQTSSKPDAQVAQRPAGAVLPGSKVEDRGLKLTNFGELYNYSAEMVKAGICPKSDNASTVLAKIQYGMELGMPPMQALNSLYVVNGRISLEVQGMLALVKASGQCESFSSWIEGEGENMVGWAEVQRKGGPKVRKSFSMADAKRAGLLTKDIWRGYPKDMLQNRASSRVLRPEFADILKGLVSNYEAEEMPRGEIQQADVVISDAGPPQTLEALIEAPAPHEAAVAAEAPVALSTEEHFDPERSYESMMDNLNNCVTLAELESVGKDAGFAKALARLPEGLQSALRDAYSNHPAYVAAHKGAK